MLHKAKGQYLGAIKSGLRSMQRKLAEIRLFSGLNTRLILVLNHLSDSYGAINNNWIWEDLFRSSMISLNSDKGTDKNFKILPDYHSSSACSGIPP